MVSSEYYIRGGYGQMTIFFIFMYMIHVAVAAIISNPKITKGFCRHDHVNLTLTADCDFTGIYVSIHYDKSDLSTMILQCEHPNLTCYSFGPITYSLTNETLEVSFRFKHKEHASRYVNFKTTCQNETAVIDQVFLKPCLSELTGNVTLNGPYAIIYCEHSLFNESEMGIRITNGENILATCRPGNCLEGRSLPNGVYFQVPYKAGMILLCIFDGAFLNLTNKVTAATTTPSPETSLRLLSELTSDTPYIIGGAVGGLASIMIIVLISISIVKCLKSPKTTTERYLENYMDSHSYVNTISLQPYDRSPDMRRQCDYAYMNHAFDQKNGEFDDPFSRGRYPGYSDDNSAFR